MVWSAPPRPLEYAESTLISAILNKQFAVGTTLPGERELATQLGITRPTLREALRRLERDGWLTIQQGKPTVVNDYWRDGGMNVLSGIVRHSETLPPDFVPNLLQVRHDIAPAYTRMAVEHDPAAVMDLLQHLPDDTADDYSRYDWMLHRGLTQASQNPVYGLILNSFSGFYEVLASRFYFATAQARESSRAFYHALHAAARRHDPDEAERITRTMMAASIDIWHISERSSDETLERLGG
jgi:GntR family transcriptional regulator, negative regulator for fad regulon and positive regulator of fabA